MQMCKCEDSWYLKSIFDDTVIACDIILNVTDSVSKNVTNIVPTYVMSAVSIKSDGKIVR